MYKLKYSPRFDLDIDQIWEDVYTVSQSEKIADDYILDFIMKIKSKQIIPYSGKTLYYEDIFTGYYLIRFKAYIAFYIVREDRIELIRALPSKSNYSRLLFGEHYEEDLSEENAPEYVNEDKYI